MTASLNEESGLHHRCFQITQEVVIKTIENTHKIRKKARNRVAGSKLKPGVARAYPAGFPV
jgi:hypothetical protein